MAKAKTKKKKNLLPKRIAGVKVPKTARRGRFGELLASRQGQTLLAEALLGAGAIAAGMKAKDNPKVRRAAHDMKHQLSDAGHRASEDATVATSTLAYALGEAARTFADALRHGETRAFVSRNDDADTAWTPDYGAPESTAQASPRRKQPQAQEAGPR